MQFLVVARDGSDEGALERRQKTRPTHLESIGPLVDAGNVLVGGAILSETGEMIGSMLLVDFPSRDDLDAWLTRDPYVTDGVWQESSCTRSAPRSAPGSRRRSQPVARTARIAMSSRGSPDPCASTALSIRPTISDAVAPAALVRTAASPSSPNGPRAPRSSITPSV